MYFAMLRDLPKMSQFSLKIATFSKLLGQNGVPWEHFLRLFGVCLRAEMQSTFRCYLGALFCRSVSAQHARSVVNSSQTQGPTDFSKV